MDTKVDDIGSYPLPFGLHREDFNKAYRFAKEAFINGDDPRVDEFTRKNFCDVTVESFRQKCETGLDIVNFPQQYDGIKQVGDSIHRVMEKGTFIVEEENALLPEVCLIKEEAKKLSEDLGKPVRLRVSIFGPMEQYLNEMGTVTYEDVLLQYAETVRRFAENSILNSKYVTTEVVSIDEPSFGILDLATKEEVIQRVLEKAFDVRGVVRQIHLHSSSRLADILTVKNIDVLSFEYAASPKNIESVTRKMLEAADKQVRVGIVRTDIDSILAELAAKDLLHPSAEQLVDDEETISRRFRLLRDRYGDRLAFTGPDCGLGSWPSQEAASLLLKRAVTSAKKG